MRLVVVHSHYRPGGVRRVVELALPALVAARKRDLREVVLLGGEAPDAPWLRALETRLAPVPLHAQILPEIGYISEQKGPAVKIVQRLRRFLGAVLGGEADRDTVVWAHNLGLGRNLPLARVLTDLCTRRSLPLVSHHHDWWFDNRWQRWPEMRKSGFRTLRSVNRTLLAGADTVRHATINRADHRALSRGFGSRAAWLPNPVVPSPAPDSADVARARGWLATLTGGSAPVWLVPCRLLRRKNLAEAWLLTRWLRPEAWLLTTGGASSADESGYAAALQAAADQGGWRLRLGVLSGPETGRPGIPALLAASETLLLTSLQEGFGLPNLEAAAARRPLLTRRLSNVAPDLASLGFRFPHAYDEVWIDRALFDHASEQARQSVRWRAWRCALPSAVRPFATPPPWWESGRNPWPFSRLTLPAQLEVLAHAPAESWARCAPHNPALRRWRLRAAEGALAVSPWPRQADQRLGATAYAGRFARLLHAPANRVTANAGDEAAKAFFADRLHGRNQYPLLWSRTP